MRTIAADRVTIVDYDDRWPGAFETEKRYLAEVFRDMEVSIEHVGSTAVEGLASKPIIDIMIGVPDIACAESRIEALERHDWLYLPEFEELIPERRFFRKPASGHHRFHLHAVEADSEFFRDHLIFRDCLRRDKALADSYAAEKKSLAAKTPDDRQAYQESKAKFISKVLRQQTA